MKIFQFLFIHISLKFAAKDLSNDNSVLIRMMALPPTAYKPLSGPVMVLFTGAYTRSALVSEMITLWHNASICIETESYFC